MILCRPVGIGEFRLLPVGGFRPFLSGPSDQHIVYSVLTVDHACKIARDWNTVDEQSGHAGFVTQFEIDDATAAASYPVQVAGGRNHEELWVPAQDVAEFNQYIAGAVAIVEAFIRPQVVGRLDPDSLLPVDISRSADSPHGHA